MDQAATVWLTSSRTTMCNIEYVVSKRMIGILKLLFR